MRSVVNEVMSFSVHDVAKLHTKSSEQRYPLKLFGNAIKEHVCELLKTRETESFTMAWEMNRPGNHAAVLCAAASGNEPVISS